MTKQALTGLRRAPKPIHVPVSLLGGERTPLENIIVYLKEERLLTLSTIARLVGRDPRAIGITYKRAKQKQIGETEADAEIRFPIKLLQNRTLSPAEHVVRYLHEEQLLNFSTIAELLGRDDRTIWTLYKRASEKLKV